MVYESTQAKEPAVIETSFSEPTNERTPSAVEEPTGSESAAHMVRAITVGAGHTYCTYKDLLSTSTHVCHIILLRLYGSVKLQDMQSVVTVHGLIESDYLFQMIVYLVHQ